MLKYFITVFLITVATSLWAQYAITGVVKSSEGDVLTGANVVIEGTFKGQITNAEGVFKFDRLKDDDYILKVSFMGYIDKKVSVSSKTNEKLNIVLSPSMLISDEVIVKSTRAGSETPVAYSEVSKKEIASRNMGQDVPYLLSLTPSFITTSDAGAGVGYTNFRIRGTDASRINITLNGIPLNDAESHGVWWVNMPDFASSVDNVQIQRGVGTSTNGAAAFGATINMQTNTFEKDAYARYSASAGSFNTFKNTVQVSSGLLKEHFVFDARLSKITSDGFIDRAWSDLKSFYVSGAYYSEKTMVKTNVFSGKERTYQAWNGVPSVRLNNDLEGMKRYGDHWLISSEQTQEMINSDSRTYNIYTYQNEIDNYQQDHYQVLLSHQFSNALSFNGAFHYTYGRGFYEQYKEGEDFEDYKLDNVVLGEQVIESTDLIRQKWLDNHFIGFTYAFNYEKGRSDISLGGAWNKYGGDHYGNIIWAQYSSNGAKDYQWYYSNGLKKDFNTYLKYNLSISESINLYSDLQFRTIDYDINGDDDDLRDLTQSHQYNFFNPKLGVSYRINKRGKVYASWAVGHREPTRSNFTDADPEGKQPIPEKLNDFEAGYEYRSGNISLGANAYAMLYDNQLILTGEINDVGGPIMVNVDDSYRVGIELLGSVRVTPDLVWKINSTISQNKVKNFTEYVDNWDTWGQETNELGMTDIAFSPSLIANSNLVWNPFSRLELALMTNYVGKQFIDNTSNNDRVLDAYCVSNVKASYVFDSKLFKEIKLNLLVNNILNAEYESNAWVYSYIYGGERYKMDGYYPQAGINFLVGLDITL